jgi:hypothetical protein
MLAQTFVCQKEKQLVLQDRAAKVHAEIVALEWRLWKKIALAVYRGVEKIPRVQDVVAEELEQLTVVLVGARASGQVYDRAGISAVLRRKRGVVDLVFRQGVDGGLERNLVLNVVVQVDAVHQPVGGVFALARGVDAERALAAQGSGEESVRRRRHGAGSEQAQVGKVAAIQRNLLHGLVVDHLADLVTGGVHQRLDGDDFHGLRTLPQGKRHVFRYRAGHIEFQPCQHGFLEPGRGDFQLVGSDREGGKKIRARGVADGFRLHAGGFTGGDDLCVRNRGSRRVGNCTLQCRCGLGVCRPRDAEHENGE